MTAPVPSVNRTPQRAAVIGVAVVLVGVIAYFALKGPSEPEPGPGPVAGDLPATPIVVSINRGGDGPAHVGYPVFLTGSALGRAGIAGMELWVGGDLVEASSTANAARPAATMEWTWTPTEPGETILVARAFDAEGRTGQSAAVRVTVDTQGPRSWQVIELTAQAGETLESVVSGSGGDPTQAAAFNPDLVPGQPFTEETVVSVPILEQAPPGEVAAATLARARISFAASLPAGLVTAVPEVTLDGCTLKVAAQDSSTAETGYQLSVLPPGGSTFLDVATLAPANGGTVSADTLALGGVNYVTFSAFSKDVVAPSAIVPIAVPDDCNSGWVGDARLSGSELVLPGPVDRAYFYLKVGEGAWQRVPAQAGMFIEPVGGKLDTAGLLPPTSGEPLRLQAWGWKDGALVARGTGTYTPPGGQQFYSGAWNFAGQEGFGFGTTLDIVNVMALGESAEQLTRSSAVDRPGPFSQSAKKTFKWSTTVQGVTHIVWQILPYPLAGQPSLTPPFLIDSGTFPTGGATTGFFKLDFKPYLTGEMPIKSVSAWAEQQLLGQIVPAAIPGGATATPKPTPVSGTTGGVVTIYPGGPYLPLPDANAGAKALDDSSLFAPPLTALYVRVIPMTGPIPAGSASNNVSFKVVEPGDPLYLDTSPPPPPPSYDNTHTLSAVFYAPTGAIGKYERCVKVITPPPIVPVGAGDWSKGTVHCYVEPDDSWSLAGAFESFVEWVGKAWDYISTGYDWIQDKIVDAVLTFVPCEQIANKVSDNGKDTCRAIAKTALQAVAVAYGVPPEIPNWESTIAGLKGDLKTFILENAKSISPVGEACDAANYANQADGSFPTCDKLIEKAIDKAVGQITEQRSKAAASVAGVATYGAIVELDPRGRPQPPHFSVTITRTNAPLPAGTTCSVRGRMESTMANWTWSEYQWTNGKATTIQKTGTVHGEPFMDNAVNIPSLNPNQSYKFDLWMTKPITWFEPDGWNDHYAEQYALWNGEHNHSWVLLTKGAQVTGMLTSNCAPDASGGQTLTGNAWQ